MLNPDLLDRFTTHLKEALQKALSFSVMNGRDLVEPGDLIVGLMMEKGSVGSELLTKAGLDVKKAEAAFRGFPATTARIATPDLSLGVKRIIEKCVLTAHLHEHKYVGTEHLLSAILEGSYPDVTAFFDANGVTPGLLREQVVQVLKSTSRFPELVNSDELEEPNDQRPPDAPRGPQPPPPGRAPRASALDSFTRDLTKPETAEQLDPVIGRDRELERVIEILCRRNKNNPILLGEPGVGKTAIVEGLAKRLSEGDVPDALHGKKLLSLDLALTVAGTMYRGEFEARLKQILDEVRNDANIILFIDEIHNIVGAGSTTGSLDAANILKPALARGEIRCVGATTWAEYKKHIEPDAALERRFQPVTVEEPSPTATLGIIEGLLEHYAKFHRVSYAADVPAACVKFAERYLTDRHFPDKAIDLLDEAAACVIARRRSRERMERLSALDLAILAADELKQDFVVEGKLDEAEVSAREATRLKKERTSLTAAYEKQREKDQPIVTMMDVAEVVSRMSGVSVPTILATERERISTLGENLRGKIIGQDAAVLAVADVVSRSRLGLSDPKRPKAAMLFVGPSGTGKTETARALAMELFGRPDALIKLDMSEFSEGHTVSKLVGSPAGYVGYRESTKLTDAVRKRPHAVVLFDEFEKAHSDVQNLLLQILEDGTISDGTGRPVSFRHAYVILTSNVGSDQIGKKTLGFGGDATDAKNLIKDELGQRFRPELLNRLDRTVIFHPLDREPLKEILRREVSEILNRVSSVQNVACHAGDDVLEWLLAQPLPPEEGARAARRLVEREVTALIGRLLAERPQKKTLQLKATAKGLRII
ncbi:ATP-dependent Clp protease ATP-binding subunit [Patescibacteria group bacterium]|nr:ATP-dependent Clp protease ATP-binding subunit [Patescibacteria group bacterium]